MRYSKSSVQMYHLVRLVSDINQGKLGIPEFQRDFDWTGSDMKSLLATVFSGWPAGSLLFLEGDSPIFKLRHMEAAPTLDKVVDSAVLDGQQRLTSLYQALYGTGDIAFAIEWDIGRDQDIEDAIISVNRKDWAKSFESVENNLEKRIIPISCLKSATEFFRWRDRLLKLLKEENKREILLEIITDLYTYRLSAMHDYEFPVVRLDKTIEPHAIARIFEKVNKTGLTLNTFDLMVAKTFDTGWNLRERWNEAREQRPLLAAFFGEDGMPLLQAIALLCVGDLRQSAVLNLSKINVYDHWEKTVEAAELVVSFLRNDCGVVRRDFMPYGNMLPPLIAILTAEPLDKIRNDLSRWFWYSGFVGAYDAASNTRLVSHYKAFLQGRADAFVLPERRTLELLTATKRNQKALWNVVNCSILKRVENKVGRALPEALIAELEVASLFSLDEIKSAAQTGLRPEYIDLQYRGSLNAFLVPKRFLSVAKKTDSRQSISLIDTSEEGRLLFGQMPSDATTMDWAEYRLAKARIILDFIEERQLTGFNVMEPEDEDMMAFVRKF